MITVSDFRINGVTVRFKNDEYPISRIKDVKVKTNTYRDHVLRIVIIGLIVSSVVGVICPDYFGMFTVPASITIGMLSALATTRKYELQVEFQHTDDTGLQWVSIAKTNSVHVKEVFEGQVQQILSKVACKP